MFNTVSLRSLYFEIPNVANSRVGITVKRAIIGMNNERSPPRNRSIKLIEKRIAEVLGYLSRSINARRPDNKNA